MCLTHINYCNTVLAGASKYVTDKLQRVLNAAARLVSNTDVLVIDMIIDNVNLYSTSIFKKPLMCYVR